MNKTDISVTINGEKITATTDARTHLGDFLREEQLLTGTHLGCEQGVCGACTLMVDGRPVRSCITLAVACDGAEVHTVEGFDDDPLMQRIRDAFKRHHGLQCGFCTPGMLTTAYDIIRRIPDASSEKIRQELSGNLCRCTGYAGIVSAIADVLGDSPPVPSITPKARTSRSKALSSETASQPSDNSPRLMRPLSGRSIDLNAEVDGIVISKTLTVEADVDAVWKIIRELPTVVSCIPGADLAGPVENDLFSGTFVVTLGPMRATFQGNGVCAIDDATRTGRVAGKGKDNLSRSTVDGLLSFGLEPLNEHHCRLQLDVTYRLQGPLAQFGRKGLVEEIADRLLADAARNITALATGQADDVKPQETLNGFNVMWGVIGSLFKRIFRM